MTRQVSRAARALHGQRDPLYEAAQLALIAEAKPEAFHRFYATWFPRVYGFAAARLPDRASAERVTRRVLAEAIRSASTAPADDLAPWLLARLQEEIAREDEDPQPRARA